MEKKISILLLVIFQHVNKAENILDSFVEPRDIEDEAQKLLEELQVIARDEIYQGLVDVSDMVYDAYWYRDTRIGDATKSINADYQRMDEELNAIKETSSSQNVEITACLEDYEELFHRQPKNATDSLTDCIAVFNEGVREVYRESDYLVDVIINEVNVFEFQLSRCAGAVVCITSIVKEIELAIVKIPQTVRAEVLNSRKKLIDQREWIKGCAEAKALLYANEGAAILASISQCVNGRLS